MKHFLTAFLLCFSVLLYAQPANDDCSGIVHLGVAPSCDSTLYNNVGATASDIGLDNLPPCWSNGPERDVWISFEASDTINDYLITVLGCPDPDLGLDAMVQPQIAVYRGDCEFDGLQLLDCATSDPTSGFIELDLLGLTPGLDYFIRIQDWSDTGTPNEGAFKFCVEKKPPVNNICAGSSQQSTGTLSDSGGEDGDYGNDENCVFTICPTQPHECLTFDLEYYNLESGIDVLSFYDGPDITSPQIASLDGFAFNGNSGGVCYSVQATSGCMTVQFVSDAGVTFEGFLGHWNISSDACQPSSLISIDDSPSEQEIVESVIEGNSLITVTDIDCPNGAMGIFEAGDNTDLGLEKGMVLTSGNAIDAASDGTVFSNENNFANGDADLDALSINYSTGTLSQDACIVEMDVFAASEKVTFEYIFGSEEYPEFVGSGFNDIFGLLASGAGITGDPVINNQQNVGVLNDGTFVEINTVNEALNWQFYRDNTFGNSVVYDGLTSDSLGVKKSLTATVPTIPCNTYHLKFAVADRGDGGYDSGVFISRIRGGTPNVGVNFLSGIEYLAENCTPMPEELVFGFDGENISQPVTYNIEIEGTADIGVDYELNIPSTITFETGAEEFIFDILPIIDNITEGMETIIINVTQDFGCGETVMASVEIPLFDDLEVTISDELPDTILVCDGACHQLMAEGADEYMWEPAGIFSDPTIANPIVCPDTSMWITVMGSTDICADVDSVFLLLVNPEIEILPDNNFALCEGDSVVLEAVNNVNNSNLEWETFFFFQFDDPNDPIQTIVPDDNLNSITLTVSVELDGCVAEEVVNIVVDIVDEPVLQGDTTICQNYSVDLGEDILNTATTYEWTPDIALNPGNNVSGPLATPEQTTTYQLISTGALGECADTSEVTITVIPADVEIQNPDTTFLCLGDTATLNAVTSTGGVGLTWSPNIALEPLSAESVLVFPTQTTWYFTTLDATPECTVFDSVLVWVDSLPALDITAEPEKESYCEGEEITLISPTYEPANFPDIDFTWLDPMPGSQTPDSFLNMVILGVEDNIYIRTTTVNACVSNDSIEIIVIPVASISVDPAQSVICQGESVQLNVISEVGEITDFSWSPPTGLSCTDCPDPVASPTSTTNYQVEGEFEGCPVGAGAVVTIAAELFNGEDGFVCPGEAYQLNNVNVPGATFSWTSSDGSFTSTDPNPVVMPTVTTTYTMVASSGNCSVEESITVTVAEPFTITIEPIGVVCYGSDAQLAINASVPGLIIEWTDENGNSLGSGETISIEELTSNLTVTATADDANNCFTDTDTYTIEVTPFFSLVDGSLFVLSGMDTIDRFIGAFEGEELRMQALVTPFPLNGATIDWYFFGDLVTSNMDTLSNTFNAPEVDMDETGRTTVIVTDEFGCVDSLALSFLVKENPVEVPNVFTPNNDGVNDFFLPVSQVPITISEFKVWNRWGQMVYDNEDPENGWNGAQNDEPALSDVYVYHIVWEIVGGSGDKKTEKGDVTLIR